MAVTSVTHVWSGETWSDDLTGEREYQGLYRVISNVPNENPQNVRSASGLPAIGSAFDTDPGAFARRRTARRLEESRLVWEVTVDYANLSLDAPPESPLDEPAKYRWTAGQYTRACIEDRNGDAVVNSAGDYFDPPPEVEDVRWSVNIQANVAEVPAAILNYAGAVNNAGFTVDGVSVDTGAAKIIGLDISELQERNDIEYRTITLVLEFRAEGYDLRLLDQGFRIKDGTELKDILIEDEDGEKNRPSSPVLLDGAGAVLEDPSPTTAEYLTFEVDKRLAFSVLPGIS